MRLLSNDLHKVRSALENTVENLDKINQRVDPIMAQLINQCILVIASCQVKLEKAETEVISRHLNSNKDG